MTKAIYLCFVLLLVGAATSVQAQPNPSQGITADDALRVFVCGSASPLGTDPKRENACIAVIAGERIFLVDTGAGSAKNLALAQMPLEHLEAVLLTHFHSDHIGALPDINMSSWVAQRSKELTVMGGEGVDQVVAGFNQAYALDRKYRTAHHGEELLPPATAGMVAKTVKPGTIYDSEGLTIRAVSVDHSPVDPALAYRFDYGGRSVVISGDTVRSKALEEAAKGADLLFHDTMAQGVVQQLQRMLATTNPRTSKLLADVQTYHATLPDVVALAEAAEVKQLVIYHTVPNPINPIATNAFKQGLPDNAVMSEDGMLFVLPKGSDAIERSQLITR